MKRKKLPSSNAWLTGATVTLAVLPNAQPSRASQPPIAPPACEQLPLALQRFAFWHENVLGTSFELMVEAVRAGEACVCEQQVLAEIARLRLILSTYDSSSEISRLRAGTPATSPELISLLSAYDLWAQRTGGAIDLNMGEVIRLWKEATASPPAPERLVSAFGEPFAYNVDALGKGYIIDRAVEVAGRFAQNGLLNIGGDIRVWGDNAWMIGIADPFSAEENGALLGHFTLRNGAVATSGGYGRFVTLDGRRLSHIIDPRTLQPATGASSATIVASDCLTANALSTAANVLGLDEGARLARQLGARDYWLVDSDGRIASSMAPTEEADTSTLPAGETDEATEPSATSAATTNPLAPGTLSAPVSGAAWPTNFQVKINVRLKIPTDGRARRPYVAVWVEDANTNLVRTITIWGNEWKYLREMNAWWKAGAKYADNFTMSVTRATRPAGSYVLAWDGLNDKKEPVPQGKYRIFVEINREHGRHVTESADLVCGTGIQTAEIKATSESEACKVEFGPKPR